MISGGAAKKYLKIVVVGRSAGGLGGRRSVGGFVVVWDGVG